MSEIDTSAEAVEDYAQRLEDNGWEGAAKVLRALVAERDAAKALNRAQAMEINARDLANDILAASRDRLAARVAALEGHIQWFLDRVERGEVRSVRSAERFRAALAGSARDDR